MSVNAAVFFSSSTKIKNLTQSIIDKSATPAVLPGVEKVSPCVLQEKSHTHKIKKIKVQFQLFPLKKNIC